MCSHALPLDMYWHACTYVCGEFHSFEMHDAATVIVNDLANF